MKRKYFFLIIALLAVVYFSGSKPTEISDRIMINAVGIDTAEAGYKVTMQIFTPEGSGSETSIDPSLPNVSIVSGAGESVNDAVKACLQKLGGNIFIGQNQIILFGRDVDLSDKENIFGFFLSSTEAFLNVPCACAENTAEEILRIPIKGSTIASEKYPDMIDSAAENGRCIRTTFIDLMDALETDKQCVILPMFSQSDSSSTAASVMPTSANAEQEEQLDETKLELKNGALFIGGKYRSQITYDQMGLAAMLLNKGDYIHSDIEFEGVRYSKTFEVNSCETEVTAENGAIVIKLSYNVSPKDAQMFDEPDKRDESNKAAMALVEKKTQSLCDSICKSHSPELLNADLYIKRFYPQIFLKYKDNLDELYSAVRFEIAIK